MTPRARHRFEILAACALLAAAFWAVIVVVLHQSRSLALEHAEEVGRNVARTLAEYEDSSIRAIDMSLVLLRHEWMRDPAGFAQAVARHEEHLRKEKVIQIAAVDREGRLLYSRLPSPPPGLDFSDRDYFQLHRQRGTDELDVSKPVAGRVTGRTAIQITRPLRDPAGRFAGLIVVAVPPPGLETIFHEIDLGADGHIKLARTDGAILARVGRQPVAPDGIPGWPGLDPAGPREGRFTAPGVDGVARLYAFRRLESHPLTVYVGQGVDTVLHSHYRQRNALLLAGAAATLLLFAVGLLLISRAKHRARLFEERERLMLELHDGCIQSIYAIGLTLENCRRLVERDPRKAASAIADAGASLNLVIQDLRAFISGEQRAPYTEAQFMAEIERMLPQHGPRFTVDVDRAVVARLSAEEGAHLLRIAREAISNVVRHANATSARLSLQRRGDAVHLDVTDDGVGVRRASHARAGLGLHHIQARARKLRGRAHVVPLPERGTRIAVEFPHRA